MTADALGARPLLGREVFAAAGDRQAAAEAEREIEVGLLQLVRRCGACCAMRTADGIHEVVGDRSPCASAWAW
jgi:hypothetical protein